MEADSAPFAVYIDGIMQQTLTSNTQFPPTTNDTLLFVRNGLPSGDHTLLVRNSPGSTIGNASSLAIDHMVAYDVLAASRYAFAPCTNCDATDTMFSPSQPLSPRFAFSLLAFPIVSADHM